MDVTEQRYQSKIVGRGTRWATAEELDAEAPTPAWRERAACKIEIKRAKLAKNGRLQRAICSCPYECGATMEKKQVKHHTTYLCKEIVKEKPEWQGRWASEKRAELAILGEKQREEVVCPMGCEEVVCKKDLAKHIKDVCDYRFGYCKNPGCGLGIPMIRLEAHEKFFCECDWVVARNELVAKVRERAGYSTPWIIKQKAAEVDGGADGKVEGVEAGVAPGQDAVTVDISGAVDESKPFD